MKKDNKLFNMAADVPSFTFNHTAANKHLSLCSSRV